MGNPSELFGNFRAHHKSCPAVLADGQLAAWPGMVAADPIRIDVDNRRMVAAAQFWDNSGQAFRVEDGGQGGIGRAGIVSPDGYSAFAVATFSSNLNDPHHMSGAGSGNGSAAASSGNLTRSSLVQEFSMFDVYFFLDAPHRFDFRGLFEGTSSLEEFPTLSAEPLGGRCS